MAVAAAAPAALGHMPRTLSLSLWWLACLGVADAVMKGISYGVSPSEGDTPRNDDMMCEEAAAQWSEAGRGDLALIRAMGANSVRLYGNDFNLTHTGFLNAAYELGLDVIPGNSDWMFIQAPESCKLTTEWDCSSQLQQTYAVSLEKGFLRSDATYHPAISYIVVVNEPDMKMLRADTPEAYTKAIISALDGMVEAEKAAGVWGPLPNFTVTYSWSICTKCGKYTDKPGLGQMWELREAMLHPSKYGYKPKNDLAELFRTRFVFSFNTANPSFEIAPLFLDDYEQEFPTTPVFIGEYHWNNKKAKQLGDIKDVLALSASRPLLLGISYFEFQKRRDIGGHLDFGIFEVGSGTVASMSYFGSEYDIKCMMPVQDAFKRSLPAQVAAAYGGDSASFEAADCLVGRSANAAQAASALAVPGGARAVTVLEAPRKLPALQKACKDAKPECIGWAARGQCEQNAAFMKVKCPVSCQTCVFHPAAPAPTSEAPATKAEATTAAPTASDCEDADVSCAAWAKGGECKNNPDYMGASCRKSCALCGSAVVLAAQPGDMPFAAAAAPAPAPPPADGAGIGGTGVAAGAGLPRGRSLRGFMHV